MTSLPPAPASRRRQPRLRVVPRPWRIAVAVLMLLTGATAASGQTKSPTKPAGRAAAKPEEPVVDATARALLEKLEEREMPDVVIWLLDRLAADSEVAAAIKAEIPFRRATALVALSRNEADSKKRATQFDAALEQIDAFLATQPVGQQAIDAYSQRGNLLVERGRMRLEQAKRPGADVQALRAEAAGSFTAAIKSLEGTVKPGQPIEKVTNAEDAVIKEFREVRDQIAALKGEDKPADPKASGGKPPPRPVRKPLVGDRQKELARLEALEEKLQVKLVQTRLMVGSAYYEKAKAHEKGSAEWKAAIEESTKQFKEVADKYPSKGGGLFARYYEGRNYAALGQREKAVGTLGGLVILESKAPVAVMLRCKALATSLECWIEDKTFDKLDESGRKFVLTPLPKKPDEDWLAMKYRAAVLLDGLAGVLDAKDKAAKGIAQRDAKKLAIEVATANGAFAKEARELAAKLGRDLPEGDQEKSFASVVAEARILVSSFQAKQAEAKKLQAEGKADEATAAFAAAAADRDKAMVMFDEALGLAGESNSEDAATNTVRYMLTYLKYDAKRYREAAELGTLLATRFPNAMGSRQASMIAMASWQQLQRQPDAAGAGDPKAALLELAAVVARTWPQEPEGGEALGILANDAIDARDPARIIAAVDAVPAASPKRAAILQRAGAALWREVQEQGRLEAGVGAAPEVVAGWKETAKAWLDEGLKAPPAAGPPFKAHVAAALARSQIALDDGNPPLAIETLENPAFGPWAVVAGDLGDASLREGSFAEAALTVALRSFIQGNAIDKAQDAMNRLEALAAKGEGDAAQRLTAMYYTMGRELKEQLERLGSGPEAAGKAAPILAGFEKFLDGLAKRDPKIASQIWVATTYLTLGSRKESGSAVPEKQVQYLKRAAEVYGGLLGRKGDAEVAKFEPSIRLKMAAIYRELAEWDEAQKQIDWILADPKRQNSIETQWQAAEILQLSGRQLAKGDAAAADQRLREAISGRPLPPAQPVAWGWGTLANKVSRQAFAGNDEKSQKARDQFFDARYNLAECLLDRARLKGTSPEAKDLALKARSSIATTRKLHKDLGGEAFRKRYEELLKKVQKELDPNNQPAGFAELDAEAAQAEAAAGQAAGKK